MIVLFLTLRKPEEGTVGDPANSEDEPLTLLDAGGQAELRLFYNKLVRLVCLTIVVAYIKVHVLLNAMRRVEE